MGSRSIRTLKREFRRLCECLGVAEEYAGWLRTTPGHDGSAHVEAEGASLCYVVTERGSELERRRTDDPDLLLYWLCSDVTFDMAVRYELEHRRPNEDFRRQLFEQQEEFLRSLSPVWAERYREEKMAVLAKHPFDDGKGR